MSSAFIQPVSLRPAAARNNYISLRSSTFSSVPVAAPSRQNAKRSSVIRCDTTPRDVVMPPVQLKPPAGAFNAAVSLGAMKASQPAAKVLLLGIVAGAYIALGALLALTVGGAVPAVKAASPGLQKMIFGAFGLPFGLTMVVTTGGELFTGNTALITTAFLKKKATFKHMMRNWFWSYIGNFVGSLLVVWLAIATASLSGPSVTAAMGIATLKTSIPFMTAFARGVACNWLVCLAVYMSVAASDFVSKFVALWLPVSAFVAMGFDHSIANMFLIPMGKALGAEVSIKAFLLGNLLPVTLGNIVGGAGLVGLVYYLAFGRDK